MFGLNLPTLPWANHWNVVFIGVVFLAMQLLLCRRFWSRMKRHHRRLSKLLRDLETGGDGREIQAYVVEMPWFKWVDTNFPRNSTTPGNYTRDDVLKELDTQIASDGSYLLLQRAGVMAPLLGVIITVAGFMLIDFSQTGEQSLGELLLIVVPLSAGVGTGALLAIINQGLLHLVGGKVERVRYAARVWFDSAIWSHVGLDTQAATVKAIQAMERMARSVNEAADREHENIQAMREGTASIRLAAHDFQETHAVLNGQFREMPGRLAELTAAIEYAVDTLDALIPVGQRAATGLDTAVASFQTAVEERFAPAAKTHHTSIETLAESVARINESTLQLRVSSGDLQDTVNSHANAFKGLNRSLVKQVLPAHEAFLAAISQFNGRAEGLLERMDRLHEEVLQSLERVSALAPEADRAIASFTAASTVFADAVQHKFAPAADEHQETMDKLTSATMQLQQAGQGLADGQNVVHALVRLQTRLSEDLDASQQTLRTAVDGLADTSVALQHSFTGDVVPAHRVLHQAADGFTESARQLAAFLADGLNPVTQRLTQLDQTFQSLEHAAAAIRDLAAARKDIEHLTHALAQSATIAEAIANLPEQIRSILERAAPERTGIAAWFHRPKGL
jgi:ABC-type transporter Mla subunit MlaD